MREMKVYSEAWLEHSEGDSQMFSPTELDDHYFAAAWID
jgi:hypothetical protein